MTRALVGFTVCLGLLVSAALAQQDIQKGTIKKVNSEKGIITITVAGEDGDFTVTDQTKFKDADFKDITLGLKDQRFKPGVKVMFKAKTEGNQQVLVGLKLGEGGKGPGPAIAKVDTSKLKPLTELGTEKYQGFEGGLYPGGKNERPTKHEAAGVALARQVQPLDKDGKPSKTGRIVLLSVGMSNTGQASNGFQKALAGFEDRNPQVVFLNGAQGGMTAFAIQDPEDGKTGTKYWTEVDNRLDNAGLSRAQVQAIWIKQADAGPTQGFPGYAQKLEKELTNLVQALPARFPNLKLVYLSSRTYAGYATTKLNPEPYAYESGFSVRWLIEKQIKGEPGLNYDAKKGAVKAPWLSWGPYLWANGTTKRADGFCYAEEDFGKDGTHLSSSGVDKVGTLMLKFFKSDTTTQPWFVAAGQGQGRGKAGQKLYVANSAGNDVTVIDVATNKVIGRIDVGPNPHGLAVPAAQDVLLVTIEGGKKGELVWIDTTTDKVLKRMTIGPAPNELAVTPDGKIAYVPVNDGNYEVIDLTEAKIIKKIHTGGRPHNTKCSRDGKHMYLAPKDNAKKVTVVDVATHAVLGHIPFGDAVRPIALMDDESLLFAQVDNLVGVEVADVAARKVLHRVPAVLKPDEEKIPSRSHGLGIHPNQKELWSCDVMHRQVQIFDISGKKPKQIAVVATGDQPYWLTFTPDGKTCYVSVKGKNGVTAIDTKTREVVAQFAVGLVPKRLVVVTPPAASGKQK
jgi:YVTN family beta-propeller protein